MGAGAAQIQARHGGPVAGQAGQRPQEQQAVEAHGAVEQVPAGHPEHALEIGREASVRAIEAATRDDNLIVIIPQKNPAVRDPGQRDLHEVGVRAEIVQVVKHSPGRFTCVMRFLERVHIDALVATEPFLVASVSPLISTSSVPGEQLLQTTAKVRDYLVAVVTDAQAKEHKEKEGKEPRGEKCPAILGLVEEGEEVMKKGENGGVVDAGLLAGAQAVEHYEMARYGTMIAWAEQLGFDKAVPLLQENLRQEKAADAKLNQIATSTVNREAA